MTPRYPFLRPSPPALSGLTEELREIENSGVYSNYGPVNTAFEHDVTAALFGNQGGCLTVCNATLGLMIAIRQVTAQWFGGADFALPPGRKYALMPAFTFAATAHAALWNGLTPLLCDVDPETWLPSAAAEDALIERYGNEIAVIIPYATFGNCLDLDRYAGLARQHGIPTVVDAAASLGAVDAGGRHWGAGFAFPVVFSMHVTKPFATGEGGLIHCGDDSCLTALRAMGNFGFGEPRSATMPGLNSKLTETGALLARAKLDGFDAILTGREALAAVYRHHLPGLGFQRLLGRRHPRQFMSVLLPPEQAAHRDAILEALAAHGVAARSYFSPHLYEQPYFQSTCRADSLPVTANIAGRILSLPLHEGLTEADVAAICALLNHIRDQHHG